MNIFIDISGSVSNCDYYWNEVNNIVQKYKSKIANYYLWNETIYSTNYDIIQRFIKDKQGYSGTCISNVAKMISKHNKPMEIIIITDGEVLSQEVILSEKFLNNNNNIIHSYSYIINKNNVLNNISVILPFIRNCNSDFYITAQNYHKSISLNDFKILDTFNNLSCNDIYDNFDKYYDLINIKNMGKDGLPIIKEYLLKIRNEFIKFANKKLDNDLTIILQNKLKNNEDTKDIIENIDYQFFNLEDNSIITKFNKLITLCDDRRTNISFNLKEKSALNSINIQPDICDIGIYNYEDPIMLDLDVPQITIIEGEPIFNDNVELKNFIENPLSILNNEEIKNKIANRIGHIIGIQTTNKIDYDPFTRRKIIGTIPLTTKNEQHLNVGNYALYALFTNKKIMGNSSLYYIILWYILNKEKKLEYINEYSSYIDEHLKYRLLNSRSYISLCGLPDFNRTLAPIDVCLYYVLNSNDNILRKHIFNSDIIIDILQNIFNYNINENRLQYIYKTKIMLSMLSLIKKDKETFTNKIKCLTNNYIEYNNTIILIDEQTPDDKLETILNSFPNYYKNVSINELIYISTLVNPNYSANDIIINNENNVNYLFKKSWHNYDLNNDGLEISLKTFRPYYYSNWKELSYNIHKIDVDEQISGYNDYIKYYLSFKKFPDFNEFALYNYNKYKKPIYNKLYDDIFKIVQQSYKKIIDYIQDNNMSYNDVKKILLNSCSIADRIRIQEFI